MFHDLILLDLDCALRKVLSKVILSKGAKLRFFLYKRAYIFVFCLGFTLCKAEQPLQGMELHENKAQKD